MTAVLHWTPEREQEIDRLAREIAEHVRAHRKRLRLSGAAYENRYNIARVSEVECARKPNYTLCMAIKLLDITGYRLAILPKVPT